VVESSPDVKPSAVLFIAPDSVEVAAFAVEVSAFVLRDFSDPSIVDFVNSVELDSAVSVPLDGSASTVAAGAGVEPWSLIGIAEVREALVESGSWLVVRVKEAAVVSLGGADEGVSVPAEVDAVTVGVKPVFKVQTEPLPSYPALHLHLEVSVVFPSSQETS
jgi:hypothetical protein